jgi:hypothetical protein
MEFLKAVTFKQTLGSQGNISLGWKGLPGTDTRAYFASALVTEKKKF